MKITIEAVVNADINTVWRTWSNPEDIRHWNTASDDWHTTESKVDLSEGGNFSSRMEAKDGSMGFYFAGTYTKIVPYKLIEYQLGDERKVSIEFRKENGQVRITETFDADSEMSVEHQRQGWQSILDNFARYVENDV